MNISKDIIDNIVKNVIEQMPNTSAVKNSGCGVFNNISEAIKKSKIAQIEYAKLKMNMREKAIMTIKSTVLDESNLTNICKMVVNETGMGVYDDKIVKHKLYAEKTAGLEDLKTEAFSGDNGLSIVEHSPFGVVCVVLPNVNATECIISTAISSISAGNSVVFCPSENSINTCIFLVDLINKELLKNNLPQNLICIISNFNKNNIDVVFKSKDVDVIILTENRTKNSFNYLSGKKVIIEGKSNTPVVVDETADIENTAKSIVDGVSFDNNMSSISERNVLAVDEICDYLMFNLNAFGAYSVCDKQIVNKLKNTVLDENGKVNIEFVGKSAKYILDKIGVSNVPNNIRAILVETLKDDVLLTNTLCMPIITFVRCENVDCAISLAVELDDFNRHTAVMYSKNIDKLTKMGKDIKTSIFVKNGMSYSGIGLNCQGKTGFVVAGVTGEGLVTTTTLTRKRVCVLIGGLDIR